VLTHHVIAATVDIPVREVILSTAPESQALVKAPSNGKSCHRVRSKMPLADLNGVVSTTALKIIREEGVRCVQVVGRIALPRHVDACVDHVTARQKS
jgi:hypothetical protein